MNEKLKKASEIIVLRFTTEKYKLFVDWEETEGSFYKCGGRVKKHGENI